MPGEGEDAAAVVRAVLATRELVGDREAAGGRRRAGAADAHHGGAEHVLAGHELEALAREVDADRDPRAAAVELAGLRLEPAELAVREVRAGHADPGAAVGGDGQRRGRSELRPRRHTGEDLAARLRPQLNRVPYAQNRKAWVS